MGMQPGTKLGTFEIVDLLGVGGMGEVYRARDMKLGREVAIKVLPEAVAGDPERLARFEREAMLLAALDHPNIGALYDFSNANGTHFLVMQLVEGETLAKRLTRGALSVEEAVSIFVQVAEALDTAHEAGIVHRDLKPANIKITRDERVKVLDFGIAKATASREASDVTSVPPRISPDATTIAATPTPPLSITGENMLIGTPGYMSPEQARGRRVDKRADVWAFGCCLYESLTGTRPFTGDTIADIISSITRDEPDLDALPQSVSQDMHRILKRCLEKDLRRRFSSMNDIAIMLEDAIGEPPSEAALATQVPAPPVRRLTVNLSPDFPMGTPEFTDYNIAISRDGMSVVYTSDSSDGRVLVLHRMDRLGAQRIPGTEGARQPFFSPDGKSVGFFSSVDQSLKHLPLEGGHTTTLCSIRMPFGACWEEDGYIYYCASPGTGLQRIPEHGGRSEEFLSPDREAGDDTLFMVCFVPGTQTVLYTATHGPRTEDCSVIAADLRTGKRCVIATGCMRPKYLRTGHVFYAEVGALTAVPFDAAALRVTGHPVRVSEPNMIEPARAPMHYDVSEDGSLVYVPESFSMQSDEERTLVWVDMSGKEEPLGLAPGYYHWPRISPEGAEIAVGVVGPQGRAVWVYDIAMNAFRPITFAGKDCFCPVWTPDGQQLVFSSTETENHFNICIAAADGSEDSRTLSENIGTRAPYQYSPDGKYLVLGGTDPQINVKVFVMDVESKSTDEITLPGANLYGAALSSDGKWIVYSSKEGGRRSIYVEPFPGGKGRWQVHTGDGQSPVWAPDGSAIYFMSDSGMQRIPTQTGSSFKFGNPTVLFKGDYVIDKALDRRMYDIAPDGERFLMIKRGPRRSQHGELIVVLNWAEEVKRRVPVGK